MTDEDKDRLVKIMAFGKDADKWPKVNKHQIEDDEDFEPEPEMDRFDECIYFNLLLHSKWLYF